MAYGKPVFTQKTYGAQLYKWSPDTNINKNSAVASQGKGGKPFYCNATAGSQGQDWITTYAYSILVTPNGTQERSAYVECDYCE